jgi:tetratricopeptide (TPR) repeat protein
MERDIEVNTKPPRWLSAIAYAQVLIGIVAVVISVLAVMGLKPLLAEREALKNQVISLNAQVNSLSTQVKDAQKQLNAYREALDAARTGINQYHQGNYVGAVQSYEAALHFAPHDAYLLDLKGYSLFKAGKLPEAIDSLNASVDADPKYAWGYFDLARVYCKIGNLPQAKSAAQTAIHISRGEIRQQMASDGEFRAVCKPIIKELLP